MNAAKANLINNSWFNIVMYYIPQKLIKIENIIL